MNQDRVHLTVTGLSEGIIVIGAILRVTVFAPQALYRIVFVLKTLATLAFLIAGPQVAHAP